MGDNDSNRDSDMFSGSSDKLHSSLINVFNVRLGEDIWSYDFAGDWEGTQVEAISMALKLAKGNKEKINIRLSLESEQRAAKLGIDPYAKYVPDKRSVGRPIKLPTNYNSIGIGTDG